MEAYCMKCKQKREMKDATSTTMKNGRPAMTGTCSVCGTKLFKIGQGAGSEGTDKGAGKAADKAADKK